jgi:hypothetical protein
LRGAVVRRAPVGFGCAVCFPDELLSPSLSVWSTNDLVVSLFIDWLLPIELMPGWFCCLILFRMVRPIVVGGDRREESNRGRMRLYRSQLEQEVSETLELGFQFFFVITVTALHGVFF